MESADRSSAESETPAALDRLPPGLQRGIARLMSRWPGRILRQTLATVNRIELFDRSMTVAAQFFTSVFPILILLATWMSGRDSGPISDAVSVPEESQSVLEDAVEATGNAGFGLIGLVLVLVSATAVSRALTRAYAAIWDLPRPKSRVAAAWRWLSVALLLALGVVMVRTLVDLASGLPPGHVWQFGVSLACDVTIALFIPWILLSGAIHARLLAPGALIFGLLMLTVRPATAVWLPHALDVSADKYGFIGVAFTYLAWLNIMSLCFLASAVLGQVIASDSGWLGSRIRGPVPID